MRLQELLSTEFQLTERLAGPHPRQLAHLAQLLDVPAPRHSNQPSEAAFRKREAEREGAFQEVLSTGMDLLVKSEFSIQVLVVVLRAACELLPAKELRLVLEVLSKSLGDPWDGLNRGGEEAALATHSTRAARWLDGVFAQLYDRLAWLFLASDEPRASSAATIGDWSEIVESLGQQIERRGLRPGRWSALVERIRSIDGPQVADAPQSEEPSQELPRAESSASDLAAPQLAPTASPVSNETGDSSFASIRVSNHYWELTRRLKAFRQCLEGDDFEKANVIAADLERRLQQFDVAGVFPELFADYFEGTAEFAEELERCVPQESVRQQSLTRLYETDLARFLRTERRASQLPRFG